MSKLKNLSEADKFYASIPTNLQENIQYRIDLHTILEKDKGAQKAYLEACKHNPKIAFNSLFWTLDPRRPVGYKNMPFILRKPRQEELVDLLHWCINYQREDGSTGHDAGINKTRDEGATECVTKYMALRLINLFDEYFIVGSRDKDLVDCAGDPFTLMAKIDHAFHCLPPWLDYIKKSIDRKDMQLNVKHTNSTVKGETTNENFSAGRRSTAMFLDEFGRVKPRIAQSIEGSIHDVTNCVIYGSTHWYGSHHVFNEALISPTTKTINMLWYDNPEKNRGLYTSPDYNIIEIIDIDYYRNLCPEVFNEIRANEPFKLSDLEKSVLSCPESIQKQIKRIKFIADGCETIPGDLRSPWHDQEEEKRRGNKRDFISNVWASPVGASDQVFDGLVLQRIKSKHICNPKYKGDISFEYDKKGKIKPDSRFINSPKECLLWWGELEGGRPLQKHNYIIGADPSLGTGTSNSVASIYDVNTSEIVGVWTDPNTPYEKFADIVVALAYWCGGGTRKPFIIFENNGGHGVNFGRRLIWNGYSNVYTQKTEDKKMRKSGQKYGWHSGTGPKADILGELGIALSEGLKNYRTYKACIIHDKETLDELSDYLFLEDGGIDASKRADLTSGARERHGDRVISTALCVLATRDQSQAIIKEIKNPPIHSFAYRFQKYQEEKTREKSHDLRYWRY